MNDYIVGGRTQSQNARGFACVTTGVVRDACRQHGASPTAAAALGRALTAGALLGALLSDGQRVALKFEGNGPLKKILVEADSAGVVRGYVGAPQVELPLKQGKIDVAGAIGHAGFLTVTKDLRLKQPYKGVVQLYTSEIAEDVAFYLTESEQIPSAVGVGVLLEHSGDIAVAGGFLIQSLPPSDEQAIAALVRRIEELPPLTDIFQQQSPEAVLRLVFHDMPFDITTTHPLAFKCTCDKARIERALVSLGAEELAAIVREQDETEAHCEFCRARYRFTRQELSRLLASIQ